MNIIAEYFYLTLIIVINIYNVLIKSYDKNNPIIKDNEKIKSENKYKDKDKGFIRRYYLYGSYYYTLFTNPTIEDVLNAITIVENNKHKMTSDNYLRQNTRLNAICEKILNKYDNKKKDIIHCYYLDAYYYYTLPTNPTIKEVLYAINIVEKYKHNISSDKYLHHNTRLNAICEKILKY